MPVLSLMLVCKQWKERIAHFKACYFEMFTIRNLKEFVSVARAQFLNCSSHQHLVILISV